MADFHRQKTEIGGRKHLSPSVKVLLTWRIVKLELQLKTFGEDLQDFGEENGAMKLV